MTLEQFVEKLRPMLKNPHALTCDSGAVYLYTNEQDIIVFDANSPAAPATRKTAGKGASSFQANNSRKPSSDIISLSQVASPVIP